MCHREPHLRGDLPLIVTVGDLRSPPVHGVDAGTIKDEMQIAGLLCSSQGRTLCHREPLLRGDQPLDCDNWRPDGQNPCTVPQGGFAPRTPARSTMNRRLPRRCAPRKDRKRIKEADQANDQPQRVEEKVI